MCKTFKTLHNCVISPGLYPAHWDNLVSITLQARHP